MTPSAASSGDGTGSVELCLTSGLDPLRGGASAFRLPEDDGPMLEQSLLKLITDKLPIGIAYVDPDRVYRFANDRFAAAYGLSSEQIIGMCAKDFICEEAMDQGDPFFEAAFKGSAVDYIHPARHVDGRALIVRTFLRPDISDTGEVGGFFVCSFNVTREKEAEAKLLQTQKMDAVGKLASGLAHDFNNLLAVILGNIAPLRDVIDNEDLARTYLDPTLHAVEDGTHLIRRLMAVSRQQVLTPSVFDAEDCIDHFVKLFRNSLRPDVTLQVEARPGLPPVYLDRMQLEMSLVNICMNACDAMPNGGRIVISLSMPDTDGQFLRLSIADSGGGMSEAVRSRIFEPFYTTKDSGKGTGLGLSMVWGFLEQSKGTISVESREGQGSIFHLDLPVAAHGSSLAKPAPTEHPRQTGGSGMVLLVDDNHALRRTIRRELNQAGYAVLEAESTEEARPLVEAVEGLRALVSDIAMEGASGFELAAHARKCRPDLRIVLITGADLTQPADCERDIATLQKPFHIAELVRAIEAS